VLLLEIPEVFVDLPRGSTSLLLHPSRHRRNVRGQLVPVESLRIPGLQGGFESENLWLTQAKKVNPFLRFNMW
jgi:hypothetical protein